MHVYEAVVRGLESVGVGAAFGGNGENIARLTLALQRSDKTNTIMARHEQAASFMACGYAMFTDKLGVCFATVGPGAFNLISAVNDTSGRDGTPDSRAIFHGVVADFEEVFAKALASNRPTVIDAKITRWALPHYSSSPEGVAHGVWELIEQRLRGGRAGD